MTRTVAAFVVVAVFSLTVATAAYAGDRFGAESAAKRAASNYVEKLGVYYPPAMWNASCHEKGRKWKCSVSTDNGQCAGTVRLRERRSGGFKAYKRNIFCGE